MWQIGMVVYRFEILRGSCNDDHRSLFEFRSPNLVIVSTCTAVGRQGVRRWPPPLRISSWGKPLYPAIAQSAGIAGVVALEIRVDANGRVTRSKALTNMPLLADPAIELSRSWIAETSEAAHGIVALEFAFDDDEPCPEQRPRGGRSKLFAGDHVSVRVATKRCAAQVTSNRRLGSHGQETHFENLCGPAPYSDPNVFYSPCREDGWSPSTDVHRVNTRAS
jgi:hypothetical protein